MIETDQDRLEMLKALGEVVIVGSKEVTAIFNKVYFEEIESPGLSSSEQAITCRTIDVESASRGTLVQLSNGDYYSVTSVEPDSDGITVLRLRDG